MLLADLRDLYRKDLGSIYPREEIDAIFYTLLDHHLGLPRFVLGLEPRKFIGREEEGPMLESLTRLCNNEPVQYITGKAHFMDMELEVGPGVLIPRPETEGLVRWALETYRDKELPGRILDAGTGSGCIALALAKELPEAEVHAMDISKEALSRAERNSKILGLPVQWHQADLCDPAPVHIKCDLLISNPPYVPVSESVEMHASVRESEPSLALFVPDSDPLTFYHCLLRLGLQWLRPGGMLFVETHYTLGMEVAAAFQEAGYTEIRLKKDIFGKDRYVCGSPPEKP